MAYPSIEAIGAYATGLALAAAAVFKVWRTKSQTGLANGKDTIEGAGLQLVLGQLKLQNEELREERDRARISEHESWAHRAKDAETIAILRSENANMLLRNAFQAERMHRQAAHIRKLQATLPEDVQKLLSSDFGELDS